MSATNDTSTRGVERLIVGERAFDGGVPLGRPHHHVPYTAVATRTVAMVELTLGTITSTTVAAEGWRRSTFSAMST